MQALQMRTGLLAAILLMAIGPWSHAATSSHRPYVDGELLVKYRENRASERALHYRAMWRLSTIRTFENSGLRKVMMPDDMTMNQALAIYRSDPEVLYAEPNYRYRLQAIPDDAEMGNLWGLVNDGATGTADADMDADQAWDLETGSRDIVVAVVDSGVDANHPDLAANIWTNPGETPGNGVDDDNNGYVDDVHGWDFADDDNHPEAPVDTHGHGTHVAGIIGSVGNNGAGVVGVCWEVSIMPLRFITAADYGTTEDAIDAIRYAAENGADVINLSWGGGGYSQALKDEIDSAGLAGALVVCAAGNDGNNLDDIKTYPASFDSANVLSVGASDADDEPAWFTNYSDSLVDVAAPGSGILSTVPDRRTLLSDDFSTLANWSTGGDIAWGLQSIGGEAMLTESPAGNYADNMDAWVRLDPLDLSEVSGTRLDFKIIGRTVDSGDRLYVESSTNGTTWAPLMVGLDDGPVQAITGTINTMQLAVVDLKAYDGVGSLHIRFRFTSDDADTADGYLIDDLAVTCADTTHGIDEYAYYQGTSMSAAYASGTAALILAQKPTLTPTEVRLLIESTVDPKPQLAGYAATGGRVNAYRALVSVAAVDLNSHAAATDRIDLDWTTGEPVDSGFEIQRRPASGSDYTTIAIVGTDDFAYIDSGLSDGTTYIYRVLTLSGGDRTGYSNEAAATTPRAASVAASSSDGGGGGGGGCFIRTAAGNVDFFKKGRGPVLGFGAALLVLVLIVWEKIRQNNQQVVEIRSNGRVGRT
jgi:subtilisin family serine protease